MKHPPKIIALYLLFVFSTYPALSRPSFCSTAKIKTSQSLKAQFKKRFIEKLNAHYDRLIKSNSMPPKNKVEYMKRYGSPEIIVCPNPQNKSQKIVYIEYEKDWWGQLYFTIVKKGKILKWTERHTHGAIVTYVKWDKNSFFYKDSTHAGTKTENICRIQKQSFKCEELKNYR